MNTANKTQIDMLTAFMEKHSDLAKAFSGKSSNARDTHRILWEKVTVSLNANGPPTKSIAEWKRFWAVRKYNAKRKLVANKKSIAKTGGGPFSIKPLDASEEAIVQACGIEAVVDGIAGVPSFGCDEHELEDQIEALIGGSVNNPTQLTPPAPPVQKVKTNYEEDLARQQIDLQAKFLQEQKENFAAIKQALGSINDSLNSIQLTLQKLCEEKSKERESSSSLKAEELKLKRMEIELAKAEIEYKLGRRN